MSKWSEEWSSPIGPFLLRLEQLPVASKSEPIKSSSSLRTLMRSFHKRRREIVEMKRIGDDYGVGVIWREEGMRKGASNAWVSFHSMSSYDTVILALVGNDLLPKKPYITHNCSSPMIYELIPTLHNPWEEWRNLDTMNWWWAQIHFEALGGYLILWNLVGISSWIRESVQP